MKHVGNVAFAVILSDNMTNGAIYSGTVVVVHSWWGHMQLRMYYSVIVPSSHSIAIDLRPGQFA